MREVEAMVKGKTIVLGVTGGIAAYKAVSLCSALVQAGAEVRVIMTESATKFVTPLTFQVISRQSVMVDTFDERDASKVAHIDLADRADLVVIAPATGNIIAKMAYGLADDMLSTTLLATTAPIMVAPAMNVHMYAHTAVQQNMNILRERGVRFIEPGEGQLACGYVGKGRLAEPEEIMNIVQSYFADQQALTGKRLIITAGGTIERIDPVRYLSNDSSGKMGFAIAQAAKDMGAQVTLIAANTKLPTPAGVQVIPVVSAQDMYDAVMERLDDSDVVIKAAAVADYRPDVQADQKIKKHEDTMTITLQKTQDILMEIGKRKTKQFVVGFAAETDNVERNALDKLKRKACDLIVANDVSIAGSGFGSEMNTVSFYDANGLIEALPAQAKTSIAVRLLQLITTRIGSIE